jgi:hypothetical protein
MAEEKGTGPRVFDRELVHTEALVVEMRDAGGARLGHSRNLSLSGIFVEVDPAPAVGEEVQLFVGSARSPMALRAIARVVHVAPGLGFGARFTDESPEGREHVANFIKRFRQDEVEGREHVKDSLEKTSRGFDE